MGVSLLRTVLIYLFVLGGVRLMGKRQIGQLQPFELVVMMLLSDLAAVPMQDTSFPLVSGLIPLVTVLALEVLLSALVMTRHRIRRFITGNPMALIKNGVIDQQMLHRVNFTLDDLLESMRLQGYSDPSELDFAILETNGDVSFFPKTETPDGIFIPLLCDGEVLSDNLQFYGYNRSWLDKQLKDRKLSPGNVFLLSANRSGHIFGVFKEKQQAKKAQK